PTISSVASGNVTSSSATITWTTNEPADSQVVYGTTPGSYPNASPVNGALATGHSVGLSGLSPGTTYVYRVKSKDAAGNLATSAEFSFVTGTGNPGPTTQNVVWTSPVNVMVTGNSITHNGCDGCQAGAVSQQTIVSGD